MATPDRSEEMKNKILLRRQALEAAIETLTYKINNLQPYYSKPQIRCWKADRANLKHQLKYLPTEKMIQRGAKRINFSNSNKY